MPLSLKINSSTLTQTSILKLNNSLNAPSILHFELIPISPTYKQKILHKIVLFCVYTKIDFCPAGFAFLNTVRVGENKRIQITIKHGTILHIIQWLFCYWLNLFNYLYDKDSIPIYLNDGIHTDTVPLLSIILNLYSHAPDWIFISSLIFIVRTKLSQQKFVHSSMTLVLL